MAWAAVGKAALAIGIPLLFEYGDDIAEGVAGWFDKKGEAKKGDGGGDAEPQRPAQPSLDRQIASREARGELAAGGLPKLTQEQAQAVSVIASVCNVLAIFSEDERRAIAMALLVNAWHESRLRWRAHNPKGEDSRGLFQINLRAHPYWRGVDLYDPAKNTACILILALKSPQFLEAVASQDLARLVYAICRYVERPKNPHEAALRRVETARAWYGKAAA